MKNPVDWVFHRASRWVSLYVKGESLSPRKLVTNPDLRICVSTLAGKKLRKRGSIFGSHFE